MEPQQTVPDTSFDGWFLDPAALSNQLPPSLSDVEFMSLWEQSLLNVEAQQDDPRPPKRRRGKQYMGCLTCRHRKIKCDGRQPICANCERSRRYACRGYLYPSQQTGLAQAYTSPPRLSLDPGRADQLCSDTQHEQSAEVSVNNHHHGTAQEGRVETSQEQYLNVAGAISIDSLQRPELQPERDITVLAGHTEPDSTRDSWPFEVTGGETALAATNVDAQMLQHYQRVVSHIMMPAIDVARNPWLQLYLPMAMGEHPTAPELALRHALISVAAFHLAQTEELRSQMYRQTAVEHRAKARKLLQEQLAEKFHAFDHSAKYAALAAAMTLISTDVFSSDSVDSNTHLNLAKRIVQKTGGERFWTSTYQSSVLYQILRCYDMVATTTQLHVSNSDGQCPSDGSDHSTSSEESENADEVNPQDDPISQSRNNNEHCDVFMFRDHYIWDTTFGIGFETTSMLYQIIRLRAACEKHGNINPLPDELVKAVQDLESQLEASLGTHQHSR